MLFIIDICVISLIEVITKDPQKEIRWQLHSLCLFEDIIISSLRAKLINPNTRQ